MKTKIKSTSLILVATIILMAISSIVTTGAIKKQEKLWRFKNQVMNMSALESKSRQT